MANSINTNIAAYFAQANINVASAAASNSVARLSSGNRIVKASDDITGLAIGTALRTGVSALRTALSNAAQGTSLLQVADGALSQITEILQRQKAIAQQAGSGTLQNADRAFLDQEFQALSAEIDRLTSSTTFNGVNLIDGSIAGALNVTTNTADGASASVAGGASIATFSASLPATGDTITIQGVTVTFTQAETGTTAAAGRVNVGSSATTTAQNLAAYLNQLGDPHFANLSFENTGGTLVVNYTGGDGSASGSLSITATSSFTSTANTTANTTINISTGTDGLGVDRFSYTGAITGSIFVSGGTAANQVGAALDLSNVRDNADFIGKFGSGRVGLITGIYGGAADRAALSVTIGDITYTTDATTDFTPGATSVVELTFTGANQFGAAKGGTFVIKLDGAVTATGFTSQTTLDDVISKINQGLSGISVQQNRDLLGFVPGGVVTLPGSAVQIANLSGVTVDYRSDNFDSVKISSVKVTAPGVGSTDALIEVVINGEIYRSLSGIGNQIGKSKVLALQNISDSSKVISLVTGHTAIADSTTTTIDLSTQAKADAVQAALEEAFGLGNAGASLNFQIGSTATDVLGVSIGAATTTSLFGGASINVLTQEDAAAAGAVLDTAIKTATSLRAGVGSLQSRFAFAGANLQIGIQNQDAARSDLLDTDIAVEATAYATSQVKLQAGISVLAQANQQLQSLLKLIG